MSRSIDNLSDECSIFLVNGGECNKRIININYLLEHLVKSDEYLKEYFKSKNIEFKEDSQYLRNVDNEITEFTEFLIFDSGKRNRIRLSNSVNKFMEHAGWFSGIMHEEKISLDSLAFGTIFSRNEIVKYFFEKHGIDFDDLFIDVLDQGFKRERSARLKQNVV